MTGQGGRSQPWLHVDLRGVVLVGSHDHYHRRLRPQPKACSCRNNLATLSVIFSFSPIPRTYLGKLIGGFTAISGIFILTLPIPIVVNSFASYYKVRLGTQFRKPSFECGSSVFIHDKNKKKSFISPPEPAVEERGGAEEAGEVQGGRGRGHGVEEVQHVQTGISLRLLRHCALIYTTDHLWGSHLYERKSTLYPDHLLVLPYRQSINYLVGTYLSWRKSTLYPYHLYSASLYPVTL